MKRERKRNFHWLKTHRVEVFAWTGFSLILTGFMLIMQGLGNSAEIMDLGNKMFFAGLATVLITTFVPHHED